MWLVLKYIAVLHGLTGVKVKIHFVKLLNVATDIRVNWEIYNEEPDDSQLIDLIVDVGNPFPKMVNEKEVECNYEGSDRPLITVDVRKHAGKRADMPFSLHPPQQVRDNSDFLWLWWALVFSI